MRSKLGLMFLVQVLLTTSLYSQVLTIGTHFAGVPDGGPDSSSGTVRTVIDLSAPASATGIVTSAHLYWSAAGCIDAVKVKFFRPSTRLTMTAERGPFSVSTKDFTVTFSPPVPVLEGDVIGLTRLTNCGTPMLFDDQDGRYAVFSSDYVGPYSNGYNSNFGNRLALSGTGIETEDLLRGVIPIVGSTSGSGGSSFKTSLQLLHGAGTTEGPITGKLVFHPANTSGTSSDPTVTYTLSPGQVISYSDIAATFGRFGIGSIDLMTTQTATKPVIIARVFNDAGAAGTSGLTEDFIDLADARVLNAGFTGFLVTPVEPSKTRFNIGVRTLLSGATLIVVLRDTDGNVIRTLTKSYQPNWFEQVDSTTFLGGMVVRSNESIAITVATGSAVVYGSTTDNKTNDPTSNTRSHYSVTSTLSSVLHHLPNVIAGDANRKGGLAAALSRSMR
jgi:hypothetical protein